LLALGDEHGAPIWRSLDDDEVREVSQIMSNLGTVSSSLIEGLLIDFVSQMSSTGSLLGSYDSTQRLLQKFLPKDRVGSVMEEIRGPAGRTMWDKLGNVNEQVLANYLKNEYPQTVAVVLTKIKSEHAARVLGALPEEFALEVVTRMLRMESVQKDILDKVEQTLRAEFMSNLARTTKRDAHELMAEIFNNFDRQTEGRFMTALEERNRDAAEKIKALMFTFEDLGKLDAGSIQTLLRAVDKDKLGIALKGASAALRDLFFSNMSERAGKILREDMEAMGPVRLKDVDEAQMNMVNVAKDLAAKGEIMIAQGNADDELIY
jgi:flagellar motor switch protein FliG